MPRSKQQRISMLLLGLLMTLTSLPGNSHGRYVLPSHTVLSGDAAQWVTLSASISNDVFHPDRPLGDDGNSRFEHHLESLFQILQNTITDPNGKSSPLRWQAHSRNSVADVQLNQPGTYRISLFQPTTYMSTFTTPEGKPGRQFGREPKLPAGARDIVRRSFSSRVVTYLSYNQPNHAALVPTRLGLELGGNSHPNDLFAGEPIELQLLLNGEPLNKAVEVHLTPDGTRHRNQREVISTKTDNTGQFTVTLPKPGFYLLEAEVEIDANDARLDREGYGLFVTLEAFAP